MLLYIPSIVVTAVLVLFAVYAMWTRGIDLPLSSASAPQPRTPRTAAEHRRSPQPEVLAA